MSKICHPRVYLVIGILFGVLPNLHSHEDTELRLGLLGRLNGLPGQFQPSSYERRQGIPKIKTDEFRIPPFLQNWIDEEMCRKIAFSASWYHGGKPYLSIRFRNEKGDGYDLSFLLDDLSKPGIYRITATEDGGYKSEHVILTASEEAENLAAHTPKTANITAHRTGYRPSDGL